jgi:polyisoprenoid-binding protein YceI
MHRGFGWSFGLTLVLAGAAGAAEFVVRPGDDTQVVFVSRASIESFEGKTNRLEGWLQVEPTAVGDSITAHFEVDLASLDTGIKMRNQHMRRNHLETDRYPKATLDGVAVLSPAGARLEPGTPLRFEVEGTFSLHGVSRRIRLAVDVAYSTADGGRITFRTSFPVALPDYGISRPQFLFLKLAETQEVRVSGVAVAAR